MSPGPYGQLGLYPGADAAHAVQRPAALPLARLLQRLPAAQWPGVVGGLYSLCGPVQRRCAQAALDAALGQGGAVDEGAQAQQALELETAAEHVRRIALDWPRQLGALLPAANAQALLAAALASVSDCPLLHPMPQAPARTARQPRQAPQPISAQPQRYPEPEHQPPSAATWLAQAWLGCPAQLWLQHWQQDGWAWLQHWSQQHSLWLPSLLRQVWSAAIELPPLPALRLPSHGVGTGAGAEGAGQLEAYAPAAPDPQGGAVHPPVPHTGVWTRAARQRPAWLHSGSLLGERIAELAQLSLRLAEPGAQPASAPLLASGSAALAVGSGCAWAEMARGLLWHQITLPAAEANPATLAGLGAGVVAAAGSAAAGPAALHGPAPETGLRLLAPTDWNFAPHGLAAHTLARLDPADPACAARVHVLMAALDPCQPYAILAWPKA